jgi:hypothetical protein
MQADICGTPKPGGVVSRTNEGVAAMINQPEQPDDDPREDSQDTVQPDARQQQGPMTDAKKQEVKPNAKKQEV